MEEFNILVIDDDSQQKKLLEEAISEINEESDLLFKFEMADNPEKAMLELYKNNYQAIIIDLNLKSTDANIKDEEISGNILLNQIIDKEIIPTIIRTGFPEKISERINKNIVEVCTKDDPPLYDIIPSLSVQKLKYKCKVPLIQNFTLLFYLFFLLCTNLYHNNLILLILLFLFSILFLVIYLTLSFLHFLVIYNIHLLSWLLLRYS